MERPARNSAGGGTIRSHSQLAPFAPTCANTNERGRGRGRGRGVERNHGVAACPSLAMARSKEQSGLQWRAQWVADRQPSASHRRAGAGCRWPIAIGLVAVRELMAGSQWMRLLDANPQRLSRVGPSTVKSVLAARTH